MLKRYYQGYKLDKYRKTNKATKIIQNKIKNANKNGRDLKFNNTRVKTVKKRDTNDPNDSTKVTTILES